MDKPSKKIPIEDGDRGRIVLEVPGTEFDEDGEVVGDTIELHLEDWTFIPGTEPTRDHPGDPAEICLTVAWLTGDKFARTGDEADDLFDLHSEKIYEAIEFYEAENW